MSSVGFIKPGSLPCELESKLALQKSFSSSSKELFMIDSVQLLRSVISKTSKKHCNPLEESILELRKDLRTPEKIAEFLKYLIDIVIDMEAEDTEDDEFAITDDEVQVDEYRYDRSDSNLPALGIRESTEYEEEILSNGHILSRELRLQASQLLWSDHISNELDSTYLCELRIAYENISPNLRFLHPAKSYDEFLHRIGFQEPEPVSEPASHQRMKDAFRRIYTRSLK
jgi:hypothetical protein